MRILLLASLLLLVLAGCNNQSIESQTADKDSANAPGLPDTLSKLVKTASINFKVTDVQQAARRISAFAKDLGGTVFDQTLTNTTEGQRELTLSQDSVLVIAASTPQADMTVRVPSNQLETFLYGVSDLGYYTGSSNLHIDDKSLPWLENALRQKARNQLLSHGTTQRTRASDSAALALRDEAITQQIDNRAIDRDVAWSTIHLTVFQNSIVRKETVANTDLTGYRLSFGRRLGDALAEGWSRFLDFCLLLLHAWPFLLLIGALLFGYRYYARKEKMAAS